MLSNKKAQSTLEYITLFTAIVAAVVILAYAKLRPAVSSMLDASAEKIKAAADNFKTNTAVP